MTLPPTPGPVPVPGYPWTTAGGYYLKTGPGFEETRRHWRGILVERGWSRPAADRAATVLAAPALDAGPDGTSGLMRTASRYMRALFGWDTWPEDAPRLVSHPEIADDLTLMMLAWFRARSPAVHDVCDDAIGTLLDPRDRPYPLMPPAPLEARPGFTPDPEISGLVAGLLDRAVRQGRVFDPFPPRVRALAVLSVFPPGPRSHLRTEWTVMWFYALPSFGDRPDLVAEIAERSLRAYRRLAVALGHDPADTPDGLVLRWLTDLFEHWEEGRPIPDWLWPEFPSEDGDSAGP